MAKHALVTGYLNGMGKGTYEALKAAGYDVIGWDIADDPAVAVDVSSEESVRAGIERFPEGLKLDAVALCAGIWSEAPFMQTSFDEYRRLMDNDMFGMFNCVQQLVPHMNPHGAFCCISSASGQRGVAFESAYSAAKFGICGFVEAVARELAAAPRRLRINAVCPFYVRTKMTTDALIEKERLTGITVEESYKLEARDVPLGYVAEPADIADFIVALLGPASRYVTGACIPISGGTHCGYGNPLSSYDTDESYD